jgi:acyl-CoA thioesterase-1
MRRAALAWWSLIAALALELAVGGCGGGSSSATAPTATGTRIPVSFDFGANDPLRATAFGDSITAGVLGLRPRVLGLSTTNNYPNLLQNMLRSLDPAWRVINRGVGGELTPDGLARLPGVLGADRPGFVLIMEGTNDADRGTSAAAIVANLDAMIGRAQDNRTVPIIGTIPPNFRNDPGAQAIIGEANPQIRALAQARRITLAEIFNGMNDRTLFGSPELGIDDPLHPNERGYAVMAGIWFDALQKTIPAAPVALHRR